jgi:MATE family multidrug resistance protein
MHPRRPYLQELARLAKLAIPLAAVQAGNQLMGVVDTAVLGRLGSVELAAAGLANGIFFTFSTLGIGTMMGLDPLISQALGAGETQRARRLLWQGVWLALALTVALSLPIAIAPLALVPAGIEAEVASIAERYLLLRLPGLFFFLLFFALRSYLQAMGTTRALFGAMIAANVLNLVGDIVLVFGGEILPLWTGPLRNIPALGVDGAAIVTNLCLVLQLVFLFGAIRKIPAPAVSRGWDRAEVLAAARVGIPVGVQLLAEVTIFALVGLLAGRLGAAKLAAHQVSLTLASLSFTTAVGIASAASVRVGWGIGAGDALSVRRSGNLSFVAGAGIMAAASLSFLLVPELLASLLTNDPRVIEWARPLLAIAALFAISDGIQAVGAGVLRGAGDTRFAFVANLIGHWCVGLPVALLLATRLDIYGLWLGLTVGLTVVAVALYLRFRHLTSRPLRRIEAPLEPAPP